jgi:hypothetical protein
MPASVIETEALLHAELAQSFESLGFSPVAGSEWETASVSWWFARPRGKAWDMIWCRLRWRPTAIMTIDLVASRHAAAVLRKRGLEGRMAAHNLHNFQTYIIGARPSGVLPQRIPLKRVRDPEWPAFATELCGRIRREIEKCGGLAWADLHESS